jgi:hypothetical protein
VAKAVFNRNKTLFARKLDLKIRKKRVKCYVWSIARFGAEIWTLRNADQKYLESSEMWCSKKMVTIIRTDRVKNEVIDQGIEKRSTYNKKQKG